MGRMFLTGVTLLGSLALLGALAIYATPGSMTASSQNAYLSPLTPEPAPILHTYIEVSSSCGPYHNGTCANMRSLPTTTAAIVDNPRTGVVLHTSGTTTDETGRLWYKIDFDEWLRYPERVSGSRYIASDVVDAFTDLGAQELLPGEHPATTTKRIVVNRTTQTLEAYDGDALFLQSPVSTGLDLTPTPRGIFHIYRKTPSRYMQGPLPGISDQYYDLPGVPWNLYFTQEGGAIHGAYWHDKFGEEWSHGCVNLPLDSARTLYQWADIGTPVYVHD